MEQIEAPNKEVIQSRQLARLNSDRDWYGVMTTWNAEAVANRLRKMLEGQRYTFVAVNSGMGEDYPPEVRTGQGRQFIVVHRAPAGHLLRWVVAVEEKHLDSISKVAEK